jgi:hypothetical protein
MKGMLVLSLYCLLLTEGLCLQFISFHIIKGFGRNFLEIVGVKSLFQEIHRSFGPCMDGREVRPTETKYNRGGERRPYLIPSPSV